MFCRETYCCICGCPFTSVGLRNPESPDPNEDVLLPYKDPYDERFLSSEQTKWLTDFRMIGPIYKSLSKALASTGDLSLLTKFSSKGIFISDPAGWDSGYDRCSEIYTADGTTDLTPVWDSDEDDENVFFPIHVSCLTLMEHLCHSRKAHLPHMYNSKSAPADLEAFCDVLRHRREKDDHPDPQDVSKNHYHGRCGGLEWQHSYYGARQSWGGEWDNEEGGEWLCADPLNVPNMSAYIVSQMPKTRNSTDISSTLITDRFEATQSLPSTNNRTCLSDIPTEILSAICTDLPFLSVIALRRTSRIIRARVNSILTQHFWRSRVQAGEVLPWLFPGEFDDEGASAPLDCDWEEGLKALNAMARSVSTRKSRYEEVALPGARPIGLENRWRIWKVLQGMGADREVLP